MTVHVHKQKKVLPYTQAQLYALVADVESYPEFLPWCIALRVRKHEGNVLFADLMVGFKLIRETFTSRVTFTPNERIDVEYLEGPFKYLQNHWIFVPQDDGCLIDFYVEFEFRSRVLGRLMEPLFNEAVRRMVNAFEARARTLYGEPHGRPSVHPA